MGIFAYLMWAEGREMGSLGIRLCPHTYLSCDFLFHIRAPVRPSDMCICQLAFLARTPDRRASCSLGILTYCRHSAIAQESGWWRVLHTGYRYCCGCPNMETVTCWGSPIADSMEHSWSMNQAFVTTCARGRWKKTPGPRPRIMR